MPYNYVHHIKLVCYLVRSIFRLCFYLLKEKQVNFLYCWLFRSFFLHLCLWVQTFFIYRIFKLEPKFCDEISVQCFMLLFIFLNFVYLVSYNLYLVPLSLFGFFVYRYGILASSVQIT